MLFNLYLWYNRHTWDDIIIFYIFKYLFSIIIFSYIKQQFSLFIFHIIFFVREYSKII